MTKPFARSATQLPMVSWNDWDNVQLVKSAIRGLEMGTFDRAAMVVDAMGRDDRIQGCLETRTRAVPALPMTFEPRGDGRQKKAVATELDEVFEEMYPDSALANLLQWGTLLGVGLGQHVWEYGTNRWIPKLKVWHPRFLSYRQDTQSYWVQTMEGMQEVIPGDGQWILYTPYGFDRGWMQGKVRSLYVPWLMRTWGLRDWARYSEVHGHPIKKLVTPAGAEEEDKQRFMNEVAAIGVESLVRTPRTASSGGPGDTDRYDVELLEAMNNNWMTFQGLIDKADACVSINILGQNLTTEVKGGSFAAAKSHMQIREDVLQFDGDSISQCLHQQSIPWWSQHNFGSKDLAPKPQFKTKSKAPEEMKAKGEGLIALGEGINALKAAGVKPDVDKIMELEDIPVTAPADLNFPLPKVGAEEPVKPAGPRRDVKASVLAQDGDAAPAAAVEGQLYVDRLADDGAAAMREAMATNLSKVLSIIKDAPDYATLRKRLVEAFGELDEDASAELLQQAMLMSALAGRYAVRKETDLPTEPEDYEEEEV